MSTHERKDVDLGDLGDTRHIAPTILENRTK